MKPKNVQEMFFKTLKPKSPTLLTPQKAEPSRSPKQAAEHHRLPVFWDRLDQGPDPRVEFASGNVWRLRVFFKWLLLLGLHMGSGKSHGLFLMPCYYVVFARTSRLSGGSCNLCLVKSCLSCTKVLWLESHVQHAIRLETFRRHETRAKKCQALCKANAQFTGCLAKSQIPILLGKYALFNLSCIHLPHPGQDFCKGSTEVRHPETRLLSLGGTFAHAFKASGCNLCFLRLLGWSGDGSAWCSDGSEMVLVRLLHGFKCSSNAVLQICHVWAISVHTTPLMINQNSRPEVLFP